MGKTAAFGLRACKGGAAAIGLVIEMGAPRVLSSVFLKTSDGDRHSLEPYAIAAELASGSGNATSAAIAAVAEGRRRQDQCAARHLGEFEAQMAGAGFEPVVAALLINRAGWITDLLEYSLGWPEHVPVAELLAVRDALRFGLRSCAIEFVELDEKSLPEIAARELEMPREQLEARLKLLGATAGRPWRKEQKLASLAAWVAAARLV